MKKVLAVLSALLILVLGASISSAQPIPNVQVFWTCDYGVYGQTALPQCPPDPIGTVFDSCYVVASNFGMYMTGIEYMIEYPPQITWISDNECGDLAIGTSPLGIASAWVLPQNAFDQFMVNKVKFIYMCQECMQGTNIPVDVVPHPDTGFVRATRWPDEVFIVAIGMRSLICPTIPVEETTWGTIKALYND